MDHFFTSNTSDSQVIFDEDESKHIVRVFRKKVGDSIVATDGRGHEYICILSKIEKGRCIADIVESKVYPPLKEGKLTIGISPLRQQARFDFFVEKCAELGVDTIVPLICQRSIKKKVNEKRLQKILVSGLKQSKNRYLTQIHKAIEFSDGINQSHYKNKYIASCISNLPLLKSQPFDRDTIILIGPEGDFTNQEYELALKEGYKGISLGSQRYRTETAGILVAIIASL